MPINEEYRKWGESAYYWDLYRKTIEQIYAPITEAILSRADIHGVHRLLDVGGGAGEPSLTIKKKTGAVIYYTDPAKQMAAFARAEANSRKLKKIYFCACSGDQLPFPNKTFDRIVARLSIMFIPNTTQGIREIMRVTRSGGRITFAVWNDTKKNPMHSVPVDALKSLLPADPQPADAPGPFRFAEPGKLARHLQEASAISIEETPIEFEISAIRNIDEFWDIRSQMSESLRDKLAKLSSRERDLAANTVKEAVQKYYLDGAIRFPASIRIISALVP
jgi:SAM-dependent methyltransferase